jgi:serine/threonine protein kinase
MVMADQPQFRRADTGQREPFEAEVDGDEIPAPAGRCLTVRLVTLPDGTRLRQHRPVPGQYRSLGYERLDNEVLAGRQLSDITEGAGCPPEVSRFYGDNDDTAPDAPFALFEEYHGVPLSEAEFIGEERTQFQASLLRGVCWLAAAGISHRALNPDTVWWDGDSGRVQITDFSLSTVFGAPRTPVAGQEAWVPRDLREATFASGPVGERDDIWAAGRLIYHVRNNGAPLSKEGLARGGLDELLENVFKPPVMRPTASELLHRLGENSPAPSWSGESAEWRRDRELFLRERGRLHPGARDPDDFCADLGNRPGPARPGGPAYPGSPGSPGAPAEAPPPRPPATPPAAAPGNTESWPVSGGNSEQRRWPPRRRHGAK